MKPLNKLAIIAAVGLPCCFAVSTLFRRRVSNELKKTRIYNEAIEELRQHRGAIYLLGQPISDLNARFNSAGVRKEKRMDVKIGVLGPKSSGILFYSTTADEKDEIQLDSVQLQVGKDTTRRLVIKKSRKEIDENSFSNETADSSSNDDTKNSASKVEVKKTSPNNETTNSSPKIESSSSENS